MMKAKFLLTTTFILAFSAVSFGQFTVTPKKVTYKRTESGIPDHKRSFEVTYPKVAGGQDYLNQKIEQAISYWSNFDTTLEEERSDGWLYELKYKLIYNKNGILVVELMRSGSGAYPSDYFKTVVVDLSLGSRLRFTDVFQNRIELLKRLDDAQKAEMKSALEKEKAEIIRDRKESGITEPFTEEDSALRELFREAPRASDQVEQFSISDDGVTFLFDYEFVHAVKALQPGGRYFFSWAKMKPFIKEYGPLWDISAKRVALNKAIPILDLKLGALLGGVRNGKFVNAVTTAKDLSGSMNYNLFLPAKSWSKMTAKLAADQMEEVCPDFRSIEAAPKAKSGVAIGNNAKWNASPRPVTELSSRNRNYRSIVKRFLQSKGIRNPRVSIQQIYRVDLEGNGDDEVVIRATNYRKFGPATKTGDYSFVMVRKFGKSGVENILLTGDFAAKPVEFCAPNRHEISAIVDLDGDGKMEIVVYGEYYEGSWVEVYRMNGTKPEKVLEAGCGV